MIAPRQTRLHRSADLQSFQAAISQLSLHHDLHAAQSCAVIVPTRAAAAELRLTMETSALGGRIAGEPCTGRALALPDLVTREALYDRLAGKASDAPLFVSAYEREVLGHASARDAIDQGFDPPFRVRAALIGPIFSLYDALRRQHRTLDAFERLMVDELEPSAGIDRGAERLLRQTRFLVAAFRAYEARLVAAGLVDEHGLRQFLLQASFAAPYRQVVVTVADQAADSHGLWAADFDLLTRLPALERIDVVVTERLLATGFHERLHDLLPGIEEVRCAVTARPLPRLVVSGEDASDLFSTWRDREEELMAVARAVKLSTVPPSRSVAEESRPLASRIGIVFQRPLPYLYLARQVLDGAGVPFEAFDALPLAAEPYAAAVDTVLACIRSDFARPDLMALLRSPHFAFFDEPHESETIDVVDRTLREARYAGGREQLVNLCTRASASILNGPRTLLSSHAAVLAVSESLEPLMRPAPASEYLSTLAAFLRAHERLPAADDAVAVRHRRARSALLSTIDALADAHRRHDDRVTTVDEIAAQLRRWIEGETFAPRTGEGGVHLVDAAAARYGDFDEIRVVGLVDGEWPEAPRRSIFYASFLLAKLGWPKEADRQLAARAAFGDLVRLPRERFAASAFALEADAIVPPSAFLEDLGDLGLEVEIAPTKARIRVFPHEGLIGTPISDVALSPAARAWLALRRSRTPADDPLFHGSSGARAPIAYAVRSIEQYLECPFRYFGARVMRLEEERPDEAALSALDRGRFIHEVFREFFAVWSRTGRAAITLDTLAEALDVFTEVTDGLLKTLPPPDRPLERVRLIGSAIAVGLGERVLRHEAERRAVVVERLLEHPLNGPLRVAVASDDSDDITIRTLTIKGVADRVDMMSDGTLRVLDYKLGRPPKASRALQVPIYGLAAEQQLTASRGRRWTFAEGGYMAFGERDAFVPVVTPDERGRAVLIQSQARLLVAVAGIEAGQFPPQPDDLAICDTCPFPTVCRKDYVEPT